MIDERDFPEILYMTRRGEEQLELPLAGPQSPAEELDQLVFRAVADLPFSCADQARMLHLKTLLDPGYRYASSQERERVRQQVVGGR